MLRLPNDLHKNAHNDLLLTPLFLLHSRVHSKPSTGAMNTNRITRSLHLQSNSVIMPWNGLNILCRY